jgi:uncharacterized protein (DUF58 family)
MPGRRNALYLVVIVMLLAGLLSGRPFFFSIAYMLLAVLGFAYAWTRLTLRRTSIRRMTRSTRAQVGGAFREEFVVTNPSVLPKPWMEVRDHSDLPNHRASQVVPFLFGRRSYAWGVETIAGVRGEFRLGPVTIATGDPFGLYQPIQRVAASEQIIVYPITVPITRFPPISSSVAGGEAQRRFTHNITTNAAGVRDYSPGDSFNRIHWRSSARKETLIVKEFELDPMVDIWLFADFNRAARMDHQSIVRSGFRERITNASALIPPSTEEYVVAACASLARHFVEKTRAVGFSAYIPNRISILPERGPRQLNRILENLAIARSSSPYTLAQTLSLETHLLTRGTTAIVITSDMETDWLPGLQSLQRRGLTTVCVFVDPGSFRADIDTGDAIIAIRASGVLTLVVSMGDNLGNVLSQRQV